MFVSVFTIFRIPGLFNFTTSGRQDAQASADALSSFDDVPSGAPQPRTVDPELLHDFEEALEAASDDDASNAALLRDLLNNLSDDG